MMKILSHLLELFDDRLKRIDLPTYDALVIKVPKWDINEKGACTQILLDGVAEGFVDVRSEAQDEYKVKEES